MRYKDHKQFRLKGRDYSLSGYYSVTICTHNRVCYFGDVLIDDGRVPFVALSKIGKIAVQCWKKIPQWCDYASLDEFIIMPNHIHGIIVIRNDDVNSDGQRRNVGEIPRPQAEEFLLRSYYFSQISPKSKSLGAIIRSYKSRVTRECRECNLDFVWQPRYHDRIIRDENELMIKRIYIKNNAIKWAKGRNNVR